MSGKISITERFYIVLSFGDYPVRFKWYDLSLLQHPRRMKLYFACRTAKALLCGLR
ncbi:MAG: hypothetical protein SPH68_07360 [Candidatus Borkfalkiaceae bacterium]|nr:hypothetical protein [Clostridia bacterium]MDY6223957.1 hypothetical protein [Christensenellaceae bacterium]